MNIGLIIKALRNKKDLTLETLAFDVDVDVSHLARIEKGQRTPSFEMLESIAKALGTKVSTICALAEAEGIDGAKIDRTSAGWEGEEDLAFRQQYLMLSHDNRHIALEILRALNRVQTTT